MTKEANAAVMHVLASSELGDSTAWTIIIISNGFHKAGFINAENGVQMAENTDKDPLSML